MFTQSKLGNALMVAGIVTGMLYSWKHKTGFGKAVLFTAGGAVAGILIGGAVTKFYAPA